MPTIEILLGQTLSFESCPFKEGPAAAKHRRKGAVALRDGHILQVDEAEVVRSEHPDASVTDMGASLLMAGFIDSHVHYPQTAMIASWGKRLIDWLNTYTFPEEMRFEDEGYATKIAELYLDLALANGTTTAASFCTIHPQSVEAFFTSAARRGLRMVAGKTAMDRNAPSGLCDTAQSAYDDSAALIAKWHGTSRQTYAITPRFSPTSSAEQLAAMGTLWAQNPTCLMQTHLSEQHEEIAWVKDLFPNARDYLDTYEAAGLIGEGAVMGHSIHLEPREIARMSETKTSVAHCPTSNTFIGSGLCDVRGLMARDIAVGLGTDTGGGSSFSMLRTMAAAYEIAQLRGDNLHPSEMLYLATQGSAKALSLDNKIGNLAQGNEADIVAIDLASTRAIEQRAVRADDFWEQVFPTLMMGDDRAIAGVWSAGKRLI